MILPVLKKINKYLPENLRLFLLPNYRRLCPNILNIIFLPQLRCQYCCPYCIWNRFTPDDFKSAYHSSREWREVFTNLPPAVVTITGGEPLLYKDLSDLIEAFPKKHIISSLVTNLGAGVERLRSLKRRDFRVMVSFHPSMTTRQACVKSLLALKKSGFSNITINFVAYPDYISLIPSLKKYFENETGFFFRVDTFKDPVRKYNERELAYISEYKKSGIIAKDRTESYDFEDTSEKLCRAGKKLLVILSNGNVYSCMEGYYYSVCLPYKDKKHPQDNFYLGNVFDGNLKIRAQNTICRSACVELCDIELAGVRKRI